VPPVADANWIAKAREAPRLSAGGWERAQARMPPRPFGVLILARLPAGTSFQALPGR
jgi:hypothetical protein